MKHSVVKKNFHIVVNFMGHRGSGAEYALDMAAGFLKAGYAVSAILCSDIVNLDKWSRLPLEQLVLIKTGDHYKGMLSNTARFLLKDLKQILNRFSQRMPDVFYIAMINPLSVPLERAFRRKGVKTVYTLHDVNPHDGEKNLHYLPVFLTSNYLSRHASKVCLLTERFRDYAARKFNRSPGDFIITPHAVFTNLESETPGSGEAPLARVNFLFFGRIVAYKGIELLAKAYSRLDRELPEGEVSLRIIGSGDMSPYLPMLRDARNLHIDNRFVDSKEIPIFMRMRATFTVLPYTEASQSGVIPIAMKEMSPLVVTNLPGLMEQTLDGRLATVVEPDADSLYKALLSIVKNPAPAIDKAILARDYIDSLDWSVVADRIVSQTLG